MPTTLDPTSAETGPAKYLPLAREQRRGNALCLSGGGYRAALFHLGAATRLAELGILSTADSIVSVSGGSIFTAHLAANVQDWSPQAIATNWAAIAQAFRQFTKRNIRTLPLLRRLLPWNWFNVAAQSETLAAEYEKYLTGLKLAQLPEHPKFTFCATDMSFGVNWIFERDRAGDYQAGYLSTAKIANWPVAKAVAASSCFPPVFNPMPMHLQPADLAGGKCPAGPERDACITRLALTDGGVYDNMGLEPVWKDHAVVLVSDGGAPFEFSSDTRPLNQLLRYPDIMGNQAQSLRKRWLISSFERGELQGTYWGIGSSVADYKDTQSGRTPTMAGYSDSLVKSVISRVRTDLDAFSDAEAFVLENHGYTLASAAIEVHVPQLAQSAAPAHIPHLAFMDEKRVTLELKDSAHRWLRGRG